MRLRLSLQFFLIFTPIFLLFIILQSTDFVPPSQAQGSGDVFLAPTGNDGFSCKVYTQPCLTLRRALQVATGTNQLIYLQGGTYLDPGIGGLSELAFITRSVRIEGGFNVNYTAQSGLDSVMLAQNLVRGLVISGPTTVRLTDLTISGGKSSTTGGGIYAHSGAQLIATNLRLTGNQAVQGGALYGQEATFNLNQLQIDANQATDGAGLYVLSSTLTLNDAQFFDNAATGAGGGFYATQTDLTTIGGLSLTTNSAAIGGGGYVVGEQWTLSGGATVNANNATVLGGGVALSNTTATFAAGTLFFNNQSAGGAGLALFDGADITLSAGGITSNTATVDGGGAYVSGGAVLTLNTLTQVSGNQARRGGGLALVGGGGALNGVNLTRNTATADGGGAYLAGGGALTLTNSAAVQSNDAENGGGLYLDGGMLQANNGTIYTNTATLGGGMYATGASQVVYSGAIFENKADIGGGLYLSGTTTINGGTPALYKNRADYGGGLAAGGGSPQLNGATIYENQALKLGGGALFTTTVNGQIKNSQFYDNVTGINGGGVAVISGTAQFDTVTLRDHQARYGGAVYVENGGFHLDGAGQVTQNDVSYQGGGVYAISSTIVLTNTQVSNNSAASGAGVYLAGSGVTTLTTVTLTGNYAKSGQGGGLRLSGVGEVSLTIADSQVSANHAEGDGAGIFVDGEARDVTTVVLSNSLVSGNYITYKEQIVQVGEITETQVITYTDPDEIILPGPIFETRVTAYHGGGLYLEDATATLQANRITGNTASANGAAMYVYSTTATLVNNLIVDNVLAAGNQIVVSGDVTETLDVYHGTGVYLIRSEGNFFHNTIANNTHLNTLGGSTPATTGIYVEGPGTSMTMFNNIITSQGIGVEADPGTVGEGDANVWWDNARNWSSDAFENDFALHILDDPKFVDAANGDYHLQTDSAARDIAVDKQITVDLEGTPRPIGFQPDSGAYEQRYTAGLYLAMRSTEIFVGDGSVFTVGVLLRNDSLASVSGVTLQNTLPPEQTLLASTSAGSSQVCTSNPCSLGTIPAGTTVVVSLTVRANGAPPPNSMIKMTNQAAVNLDPAQSDTTTSLTTYLQDLYSVNPGRGFAANTPPGRAQHNGQCRIYFEGNDYSSINTAIDAFIKNTEVEGLIQVSGYCGGGVKIQIDPLEDLANKTLTIQGGWSTDLTVLDPDLYPTTFDAAGSGRALQIVGKIAPVLENIILINGQSSSGAGAYFQGGTSAILRNVRLANNNATNKGGGLYIDALSVPELDNCVIENNSASQGGGGAYLVDSGSVIKNSTFQSNSAADGGGLYLRLSDADINNNIIRNHSVSGYGGGIYLNESPAQIQYNTIANNTASVGGGVFAENKSDANLRYNTIENNTATTSPNFILGFFVSPGGGGGIYGQKSNLLIKNNVIRGNRANGGDGGGIHLWDGNAGIQIDNNAIINNSGDGIYMRLTPRVFRFWVFFPPFIIPPQPSFPLSIEAILPIEEQEPVQVRHNTIANNSGMGLRAYGRTNVTMVNNIVINNQIKGEEAVELDLFLLVLPYTFFPVPIIIPIPIPLPAFYPPTINADYTIWNSGSANFDVGGAFGSGSHSNDIVGVDPYFMLDGYHIKRISAAYNAGGNTDISSGQDIDGNSRQEGTATDIGAHEYRKLRVRYVKNGGTDTPTSNTRCTDHFNPCGTLAEGIASAWTGDLVKVARGTYNIDETLLVDKSITIQGGYIPLGDSDAQCDGDCDKWEIPFPHLFPTIVQMDGSGRVFSVTGLIEPTIAGLRLTGGQAEDGAAIYVLSSTATISQVWMYDNNADRNGGAAFFDNSPSQLVNSFVYNNEATQLGGGVYITGSTTLLHNSEIYNNQAVNGGGLYVNIAEDVKMQQGSLHDNTATEGGGGLWMNGGTAGLISVTVEANNAPRGAGLYLYSAQGGDFAGNTFKANTASVNGGGVYLQSDATTLEGNTFDDNTAAVNGGAAYLFYSEAGLKENLLQNNRAVGGGGIYVNYSSDANIEANTIDNNTASGNGGGVFILSSSTPFKNNIISNNTATNGGGFHLDKSPAALDGNQVINNQAGTYGGGLHLVSFSFAQLKQNTIAQNNAVDHGGGLYMKLSDAALRGNYILTNTSTTGHGGGLYAQLSNAPFMQNTFAANTAALDGGGLHLDQSQISFQQNSVQQNSAVGSGGGLYMVKAGQADLTENSILTNTAQTGNGGGLFLEQSPYTLLDRNTFRANVATQADGGGAYLLKSGSPLRTATIANNQAVNGGGLYLNESPAALSAVVLLDNQATLNGGGLYSQKGSPALDNVVLGRNQAAGDGSGGYLSDAESVVRHATVTANTQGDGIGLYLTGQSSLSVTNSIFTGNDVGLYAAANAQARLDYTLLHNNGVDFNGTISHTNDFSGDPAFEADGYHITKASYAMDEALPSKLGVDVDGDSRPQRGKPDLGADEYVEGCYVLLQPTSGLSRTYAIVQQAIDDANPGDTVKVGGSCDGVHARFDPLAGRTVTQTIYLSKTITVQGGYTFTNWITPDATANPTTIDAAGQGRVIYVTGDIQPRIENLILIKGSSFAQVGGPSNADAGGGIYSLNATATISNNIITTNEGGTYGGGIFLESSPSTVISNTINANVASNSGGGIFLNRSAATLQNNTISENTANKGGGIFLENSAATLTADTLLSNTVLSAGGGAFLNVSAATLNQTVLYGNSANNGAAIYLDDSDTRIIEARVTTNTAESNGGAIYLENSAAGITGTHFISNTAGSGGAAFLLNSPARLNGNRFEENNATVSGGALYLDKSPAALLNSIVANNRAANYGSGLYLWESSAKLYYNDIMRNEGGSGIGIYISGLPGSSSVIDMKNNILLMHRVGLSIDQGHTANMEATVWGSDDMWGNNQISNLIDVIGGGTVTTGTINIRAWPAFVNFDAGDYHIYSNSPAIDVGVDTGLDVDYEGHPRPTDNGFDIGADEYYRVEMSVVKFADADLVQPGDPLTYTIQVENIGNVDLNLRITDTLPLDIAPGGGYTPGQILTWTGFITRASGGANPKPGGVWRKTVAVTTLVTDSATLTNVVEVRSDKGAGEVYTSVLEVGKATVEPTIQSVKDGPWDDPATWNLGRVPDVGDEVQILPEHTVTAPADGSPINVAALHNQGALLGAGDPACADLVVETAGLLLNEGQIVGCQGDPGGNVSLTGEPLVNEAGGVIAGGKGADDAQAGGDGGDVILQGGDVTNHGEVAGGAGGELTGTGPGEAGDGGDVIIAASPGTVVNTGQVAGGAGGTANDDPDTQDGQNGGDGGDVTIVADPLAKLTGDTGGGDGGNGAGGGADGLAGALSVAALGAGGGTPQYHVTLLAPGAAGGIPGRGADLTVTLLNSGVLADIYRLTQQETNGWVTTPLPGEPLALGPTESRDLLLTLTPPITALPGMIDTMRITATSQTDGSVWHVADIVFTVQAAGPDDFGATIVSVGDGPWDDPNTWSLGRVPTADDVVIVQEGHTVTLPGPSPVVEVTVKSLCNFGVLQTDGDQPTTINAAVMLCTGPGSQIKAGAGALVLQAPSILVDGGTPPPPPAATIRGDGVVALLGDSITNNGLIEGADVILSAVGVGGDGGDGGGGGDPPPDGVASGILQNNGAIKATGDVKLLGVTIEAGGDGTIQGADVLLLATGLLDLSALQGDPPGTLPAIQANPGTLILAGSPINLHGNKKQALAGNPVSLFADAALNPAVLVDTGAGINALAGDGALLDNSGNLYDVTIFGAGQVTGQPEQDLPLQITVINSGLRADAYTLDRAHVEAWPLTTLDTPITLDSLARRTLNLTITLPYSRSRIWRDTVTVNALSPTSGVTATTEIDVRVAVLYNSWLYLPVVIK